MQLILVRHAQPHVVDFDPDGADPELTEDGHRQAEMLAKFLSSAPYGQVGHLVSSTMLRAQQTAEPLTSALDLDSTLDSRIVEIDAGWTHYGRSMAAYPTRRDAFTALNRGSFGGTPFDVDAFRTRVYTGIEDVVQRSDPNSAAVVVCHGGVISAYLSHILHIPQTFFLDAGYTSITRVLAETDGYRELLSVNEITHLMQ